jgi:hypothetical protein
LKKSSGIDKYKNFVDQLQANLNSFRAGLSDGWYEKALGLIDGVASEEVRKSIDLHTRRKYGVFFTNSLLANQVIRNLEPKFKQGCSIYDPACGAGNLLLASHGYMCDTKSLFFDTCELRGTDIHQPFVDAARLRLSIAGMLSSRNADYANYDIEPHVKIEVADGMSKNDFYESASHIIVNPPFNLMNLTEESELYAGKVCAAAIFIEQIIRNIRPGVEVMAILPDVLRSGTRYEKWRHMVGRNCEIEKVTLLGQFDQHADVDVFAFKLTKKIIPVVFVNQPNEITSASVVGDLFDVSVGKVVDFRDKDEGRRRGYIVSRGLPGWSILSKASRTRQHTGQPIAPPFVVVKRTSRMGDRFRAVATIIKTDSPVHVDNHLIVLIPKSGGIGDCQRLLRALKREETNNWLNEQIRCRHLTVKVVAKIPL